MYYNYKIKNIKVKVQINKNLAICNVNFPDCEEELQVDMRAYILNRFQGRQINDSNTEHSLYLTLKNLLSYAK